MPPDINPRQINLLLSRCCSVLLLLLSHISTIKQTITISRQIDTTPERRSIHKTKPWVSQRCVCKLQYSTVLTYPWCRSAVSCSNLYQFRRRDIFRHKFIFNILTYIHCLHSSIYSSMYPLLRTPYSSTDGSRNVIPRSTRS